jgi:hypothetical protein
LSSKKYCFYIFTISIGVPAPSGNAGGSYRGGAVWIKNDPSLRKALVFSMVSS